MKTENTVIQTEPPLATREVLSSPAPETSDPSLNNCVSVLPISTESNHTEQDVNLESVESSAAFESLQLERRGVTSHLRQGQLWQKETMWRDSIVARLVQTGREDLTRKINQCHRETIVKVCCGCKAARVFWNRCELKWCPICAERLSRERRETVEAWTKQIRQPKHVVLTVRNTENLTKQYLQWFKLQFAKLRRSKLCRNWVGGFYSIETTWGNDGAHVHLHALVNAHWIDARELARTWGKLVGQDFAIVKVQDARDRSYLGEVAKYVAKGSELAAWSGEKLAAFVEAVDGVRCFGVFGDLYKLRKEIREWLDIVHEQRNVCECGCRNFRVMDENCWEFEEIKRELAAAIPPPRNTPRNTPDNHPELFPVTQRG